MPTGVSGAGANAQKSIGFATLTGMIGSTLLTVAVVPSLFVVCSTSRRG